MDGGRRLLRPVKEVIVNIRPSFPAFAGVPTGTSLEPARLRLRQGVRARRPAHRRPLFVRFRGLVAMPGFGSVLTLAFFICVGAYGCLAGGQFADFVASEGALRDVVARTFGFGIEAVTISGEH